MNFKDKIVLITGSTQGIGKAIAKAFGRAEATVIICGRTEEKVAATVKELSADGGMCDGFAFDVCRLKNVQEIINKILDKYKRIDILINNAGITKDNLLFRLSEEDFNAVLTTNLNGVFHCTKVVAKAMLRQKSGKIINMASIVGITGNTGQANYAASKAAIIGFSKSVAKELAARGITVNVVAPGYITTEMTAQLNEKTTDEILKTIPMNTFGRPADVAGACLFLASSDAEYITGQTIIVDGGMAM